MSSFPFQTFVGTWDVVPEEARGWGCNSCTKELKPGTHYLISPRDSGRYSLMVCPECVSKFDAV